MTVPLIFPGEPREQHLGEVRQRTWKFNISNSRTFWVNLPIKSQEQKNTLFLVNFPKNCAFLGPVNSIWTLMQFSQKCGNFVIYEFSTAEKLNISDIVKWIILIFSVNLFTFIYKFSKKKYNPNTRRTSRTISRWSLNLIWTLFLCLSTKSWHNLISYYLIWSLSF